MSPLTPRIVQGALLAAFAAAVALAWSRAPENLAFHRPVVVSSLLVGEPAGVVNGLVEWGAYAVHTRGGGPAFLRIDLQETAPLGEVRIFGRGDGYYLDPREPIAVEISHDGQSFTRAAVCPRVVTQVSPCRARIGGASARYVRLFHPSDLVLSEVEVFAAR